MRMFLTGDTHGDVVTRVWNMLHGNKIENPEEAGLIILGDAGINYFLDDLDTKLKKRIESLGAYVYCVRGNHEARPNSLEDILLVFDENVSGNVYYQPQFPHIRYFIDGGLYKICGLSVLTIGGAYSVDKLWRQVDGRPWFCGELLSEDEMRVIENVHEGRSVDLVLTHTCPVSWEPTDLFLSSVEQNAVDKSMEIWLERLKEKIHWDMWMFGHYHSDRLIRPKVEMYYRDISEITDIINFWNDPDISGLEVDPNYGKGR